MQKLHIDIETYSFVDIKKAGAYKYIESPDFEIMLIAYAYDDGPINIIDIANGEDIPSRLTIDFLDNRIEKHAHNATFERLAFKKIGFDIPPKQWHCSAIKAAYCGLPLSLKDVSKALDLGDKSKSLTGAALIRYFCMPVKATKVNGGRTRNLPSHNLEKWEAFKNYCKQDVEAEREIDNILIDYNIPYKERDLYVLDQKINDRGIRIDLEMAKAAVETDNLYTSSIIEEIKALTGVENPNSPAQLKIWLTEALGKEITSLAKDNVQTLIEEVGCGAVQNVLKLKQKISKSSNKKYTAMINCCCEDNRAHGLFQFYGANRTGRWAGRLIQLQNLPRNYMDHLEFTRSVIKEGDYETISMMYDNISSTLSELVRTTFIAEKGMTFAVADFSAIEARVIAWLAGEQWRLEVFKTHGKIYEASAAMMFGVDIEEVTKGSDLRSKGKVAELALGYQGAKGALKKMGGEAMGLSEIEMDAIVKKWREANKAIVALWKSLENSAKRAMKTRRIVINQHKGLKFKYDGDYLTIQLPSGRKLFYKSPSFTINKFEQESIRYKGVDQTTKQWGWVDTYGGKISENCLSGETKVLTHDGWERLDRITMEHQVWDGENWQNHLGLISKGLQNVITVDGVTMTPDHKILIENETWKDASQSEGLIRYKVELPKSFTLRRFGRKKVYLANKMRLRERNKNDSIRVSKRKTEVLRMYEKSTDRQRYVNTQNVQSPNLCYMAFTKNEVFQSEKQSLSQLWRQRHKGLRRMGKQLRVFPNRYVPDLQEGLRHRQNRQQQRLFQRQLPLDHKETEQQKQAYEHDNRNNSGEDDNSRSLRKDGYRSHYYLLQSEKKLSLLKVIRQTGRKEQVYDLINCGPKHRFTVLGENGPLIVHNCVQAIARDLLAEAMINVDKAGFNNVMHVHDEIVCEVPEDSSPQHMERMCYLMSRNPDWAEGLPLGADGYVTPFYKKD